MPHTPQRAALKHIGAKVRAPFGFTHAQWAEVAADVRERSLFSACVTDGRFLEQIRKVTSAVRRGEITQERAKGILRDWLDRTGYEPEAGEAGTIKDLSSDQRLQVIVDTNAKLALGYGRYAWQSQRLKQWPAVELYRREERMEPRDWPSRWRQAGGRLRRGRFVAQFGSPVWTGISAFGHPYPIFDFNSGMWTKMIHASEAKKLGVAAPKATPKLPRLNEKLQTAATRKLGRRLQKAVERNLPGFIVGTDGVLRKAKRG